MCCSTVPSKDSKTFLSPMNRKVTCEFTGLEKLNSSKRNVLHLLLILVFSSSVKCSVLVLMTTFTLFTLKTWKKIKHKSEWPAVQVLVDREFVFSKCQPCNFLKPLLQIHWLLRFCLFSNLKSQICICWGKKQKLFEKTRQHHREFFCHLRTTLYSAEKIINCDGAALSKRISNPWTFLLKITVFSNYLIYSHSDNQIV